MKTRKFLAFLMSLAFVVMFTACSEDGDDDNGGGGNVNCTTFSFDVLEYVTAISDAADAYSADPTAANCNALVDAYEDYIDQVEAAFEKCGDDPVYGTSITALYDALQTYRTALAEIDCGS